MGGAVVGWIIGNLATSAAVVGAGAAAYGAKASHDARKAQAQANKKAEKAAIEAQAQQEALAAEEQATADLKLEEQRARIVKGKQGRRGLLFGSELGVEDGKSKKLG